jgi:hypothetical protein
MQWSIPLASVSHERHVFMLGDTDKCVILKELDNN